MNHNDRTTPPTLEMEKDVPSTEETMAEASSHVDDENDIMPEGGRQCSRTKMLIGLIFVGLVIFVIVDSLTNQYVRDGIRDFLDWVGEEPVPGFFLFVIVYFVATIIFIPGSLLTIGAGFVFANAFGLAPGVLLGSLAVFLGASSGAIVSFLLARYLLRDQVQKLTKRYATMQALDYALEDNGLKCFILLRLSPIIPFNAINYMAGVTAVSFRDYALALLAILPGTILYVFLGASAGSLADGEDNPTVTIIAVSVGAVVGIFAICLTVRYAKKELARVMEGRAEESRAPLASGSVAAEGTATDAAEPRDVEEGLTLPEESS